MFFRRRRNPPWWLWALALLGLRQVAREWWTRPADNGEWDEKRRKFREKIREAFRVWKEPEGEPDPEDAS